jgi:hypothetical protein
MNSAMMPPTQGNGEFIARLASERPGLRKSQVVGVRRLPTANEAGPLGNHSHVTPAQIRRGSGTASLVR